MSFLSAKASIAHGVSLNVAQPGRSVSRRLRVLAATELSDKYTDVKPVGDRVLVKASEVAQESIGGILLPSSAQQKENTGNVVATGDGKLGKRTVAMKLKSGDRVIYPKYAGTEVKFQSVDHVLLKQDDVLGKLPEGSDYSSLQPLGDRIIIQVAEAEDTSSGGVILTAAAQEKPSIGEVIACGEGSTDEEGNVTPLSVSKGNKVLYSKFSGTDLKGPDGVEYIIIRESEVLAVLE